MKNKAQLLYFLALCFPNFTFANSVSDYCQDIHKAYLATFDERSTISQKDKDDIVSLEESNKICQSTESDHSRILIRCTGRENENLPICIVAQHNRQLRISDDAPALIQPTDNIVSSLESKLLICESAAQSILGICNRKDQNLQNITAQIVRQSAHQLANASALDICSNTARMAAAVETSLSATGFACASQVGSCTEACSEAQTELKNTSSLLLPDIKTYQDRIRQAQQACRNGQVAKEQLDNGVQETLKQINVSAECRNRLSSDQKLPTYLECKANSSLKGCDFYTGLSQDCSQPQVAATNLTCICQANPTDTRCQAQLKAQNLDNGLSSDPSRRAQLGKDNDISGLNVNPYGGQDEVALPKGSDGPTGIQLANPTGGGAGGGGGSLGESLNSPYQKPQGGEGSAKSKIDPNVIGRAGGILLPTELSKIFQPDYLKNQNRQIAMLTPPQTLKEKIKNKLDEYDLERFIPDRHSFKRFTNYLAKKDPYALTYLNIVSPKICSATCVLNVVQTVVGPDAITGPDVDLFTKTSRAYIIHYHNPQELHPLLTPDVIEEIKEKGVVFKIPRPRRLTHAEMQEKYHFPSEPK